jgi:hypothetical protein
MTRRIVATAVAVFALAAAAVFALVPAAFAQVGSGIGTCTAVSGTTDVGTVTVGQQFVIQVAPTCAFNPGAALTVTVNGVSIVGKVANAGGQVLVTVTAISSTQLSVDDPTVTPAVCGVNTVTVSGPSSGSVSGVATQSATFTLTCGATATTVAPIATTGVTTISGGSVLSRTGADSLRMVAVALALLGLGSLAVVATRRRRAATL